MKIPEIIKNRRSIRSFLDKELPEEISKTLIEAACLAPSAGNLQPWEFIILKEEETKKKLVEAAYGQEFISEAKIVIVVCANPNSSAARYGTRGSSLYCLQDTAAAVQNILLTATDNGLGGCWVGAFDEKKASEALKLPREIRPVAIIPI
ncbi:nitroreductase family protein, partial [Candidatus Bathyarchaeota archaeon]|nr:nitroreductase family protein [Candidatus Bathyarchaeota archaeon]